MKIPTDNSAKMKKNMSNLTRKRCIFVDFSGVQCKTYFRGNVYRELCDDHRVNCKSYRDRRSLRNKEKKRRQKLTSLNQAYKHNFTKSMIVEFRCAEMLCKSIYRITVYPGQYEYRQYCDGCLQKHQREREDI